MNKIATLTIAGAIGLFGLAYGFSAPAAADALRGNGDRRAELVANVYGDLLGRPAGGEANGLIGLLNQVKTGELVPAVLPSGKTSITDGTLANGDGRADLITGAYGDVLNRPAGEANGLIGLLNQETTGLKSGITDGTHAVNGDGKAELITGAGGEKMQDFHFVPAVQKTGSLASLSSLGSVGDLFVMGRPGGDHAAGLLLPAVQKVREAAAQTAGGGPHVNPGEVKKLNFSNQIASSGKSAGGSTAAGNGRIDPAAAKGLNFTRTPR